MISLALDKVLTRVEIFEELVSASFGRLRILTDLIHCRLESRLYFGSLYSIGIFDTFEFSARRFFSKTAKCSTLVLTDKD